LTFSGNIVDVLEIVDNRAYIRCYYNDQKPPAVIWPAVIWPKPDCLDTRVQLLTTQYKTWLDMTTDRRYPRTVIIANPGERLWIDVANLRKVEND
jgi:hypothetical protein